MNVLLAGGGSAGHVSPLLALADRLVVDDPATAVLAIGTATGLEARLVPARGYRFQEIPQGAVASPPVAGGLPVAGGSPSGGAGGRCRDRRRQRRRRRRLRRLCLRSGLPGRPTREAADRGPRAEQPARVRQPAGRPAHPLGRRELPGHAAAPCGADRPPASLGDHDPRPGVHATGGAGVVRARPGAPDPAGGRWLAGRAAAQPGPPTGCDGPRRPRCPGAAHLRRREAVVDLPLAPAGSGVRRAGVCRPDGARLRRRRPRRRTRRREHGQRDHGAGPAGGLRAAADRQR